MANVLANLSAAWSALRGSPTPPRVERVLVERPAINLDGMGNAFSYEGGRVSRLDADFTPSLMGPNSTAEETLQLGRARATWLCDNVPIISGAQATVVNNVRGPTGIRPQPNTGDRELDKRISELWHAEADGVDVSREITIGESQGEWLSELFRVGEGAANFPVVPAWNGYDAGPAIEIIDSDRMPVTDWRWNGKDKAGAGSIPEGHFVRQGVELDQLGRRHAYHVLKQHPADNAWWTNPAAAMETIRIPATQARLGFRRVKSRPGTLRGVPWAISCIGAIRMLEGFREAAMAQARTAASLGLIFVGTTPPLRDGASEPAPFYDADGKPLSKLRPGMMGRTSGAGSVQTVGGNLPGPQFSMAEEVMLRNIAAGLGISYSALARDYSKATFSATRAESLEDRKGYRSVGELVVVHHTGPFYRRKIDWWVLSGKLKLTADQQAKRIANPSWLYQAVWIMPGWEWVNPQQEAQASQIGLEAGFLDPYTVCGQTGQHAEDVIDARLRAEQYEIEERKRLKLPPKAVGTPKPAVPAPAPTDNGDGPPPPAKPDGGSNGD